MDTAERRHCASQGSSVVSLCRPRRLLLSQSAGREYLLEDDAEWDGWLCLHLHAECDGWLCLRLHAKL